MRDNSMRLMTVLCALAAVLFCACGGVGAKAMPYERATSSDFADSDDGMMEAEAFEPPAAQVGYAANAQADRAAPAGGMPGPQPAPTAARPPPPPPPVPDAPPAPEQPVYKKAKPLLIYTANYHLAVFETTDKIDSVHKLAKDLGGYLVRRDDRNITVRVPSESFRNALAQIAKLGDVLHREETVQDVTEQFMDMQTRLKNARAMRERLEQLLAAAKDVKDALAVEKELGRITGDIERMEGKLKRLRELIAFSTITVRFQPRATDRVNSKVRLPFDWLDTLGLSNLLSL